MGLASIGWWVAKRVLAWTTVTAWRCVVALYGWLRGRAGTFGTAQWASRKMMRRAGALGERGLILGKAGKQFLRDANDEGSVLLLAPQGAGKGVGPVICNLLDYRGSILCTDPKGENFAVTARHRATLGPVYRLDVGNPALSDAFNPMSSIRWGTVDETDDAEALADLMLVPDLREESHWRRRALSWLTGFILYVGHEFRDTPELVTLAQVNDIANADPAAFKDVIEQMIDSPVTKIAETGAQIARGADSEETRNILSNLVKGTEVWSNGKPLSLLSGTSDFRFEDLYAKTITVYLIVPEEKLAIYGAALRVMTGLALNGVFRAGRVCAPPIDRPLFLLDEAAALGYLEPLEKGMGYLRAYARALIVFQDLGQLEGTYPKARSLIANAATLVTFGVNDSSTAKMLSERIGQTTVVARSAGVSQRCNDLMPDRTQDGHAEAGRALIDASEVMRLAADDVLIFMGRKVPAAIKAKRAVYFNEACFAGRWDRWRKAAGGTAPNPQPQLPLLGCGPERLQLTFASVAVIEDPTEAPLLLPYIPGGGLDGAGSLAHGS